jgi:colicin import membrane protein
MSAMRTAYWKDESGGQFKYLLGALLIHAVLGVLLVGFNWRSKPAVVPQLAINAVLVDRNTLNQLARTQAASTPPAPPAEDKKQEQEKELQEQQEREKQQQALHEQQERDKQEQLKQQQVQQQQALEKQQRLADEAEQKKQQAEAQRKAAQAEQQKQQQEADKKRLADIQQKQRDVEAKRQSDADAKAQAAKEAELKAQLAAEEGRDNAVNSGLLNQYVALIQQKIIRNWIKPPSAKAGLECEVKVTQAQGGTVLSVEVGRCNGDAAVRTSIEAAVQRASPLPAPPDPRLFERNLLFNFKPTE